MFILYAFDVLPHENIFVYKIIPRKQINAKRERGKKLGQKRKQNR